MAATICNSCGGSKEQSVPPLRAAASPQELTLPLQYFDLMAYVSPMVNWNELRFVGGSVAGGSFR